MLITYFVACSPPKLVLSMELQEAAAGPVESPENEIQSKRLVHILEARYNYFN
jgi:hypothetical protein